MIGWQHLVMLVTLTGLALSTAASAHPLTTQPPSTVRGLPPATALGWSHSARCAVAGGEVFCWGRCDEGLCGPPGSVAQTRPTKVPGLTSVTAIALYESFGCALHTDRSVSCWGRARFSDPHVLGGKAGLGPERIADLADVTKISVGDSFACALRADRRVACWGKDIDGSLGLGPRVKLGKRWPEDGQRKIDHIGVDYVDVPRVVPGVTGAVDLACDDHHCCVLDAAGAVNCWGEANYYSQADEKTRLSRNGARHRITLPSRASAIASNTDGSTCALLQGGALACWNYDSDLPYGSIVPKTCPRVVGARKFMAQPSSFVAMPGGEPLAYERNLELGVKASPLPAGMPTLIEATGRTDSGCGRTAAGEVWCWGHNDFSQLARPASPSDRSRKLLEREAAR